MKSIQELITIYPEEFCKSNTQEEKSITLTESNKPKTTEEKKISPEEFNKSVMMEEMLFKLIENNNIKRLNQLFQEVDTTIDFTAENKNGLTPLFFAISKSNSHVTELLLQAKASVDDENENRINALAYALLQNPINIEIFACILDAKPNLNIKNGGVIPLILAIYAGSSECVKMLLDVNADVRITTAAGNTPLSFALKHSPDDIVKMLLEAKSEVNVFDLDGQSPLSISISMKRVSCTQMLIENKATINTMDGGKALLEVALKNKDLPSAGLLIEAKADINVVDIGSYLSNALYTGDYTTAQTLAAMKASFSPTQKDKHINLLFYAIQESDASLTKLLLDIKVNPDAQYKANSFDLFQKTEKTVSALYYSVKYPQNSDITQLLLEARANPDSIKTEVKQHKTSSITVLEEAIFLGKHVHAMALLEAKANVNLRKVPMSNPLYFAAEKGFRHLMKRIIEAKADIDHSLAIFAATNNPQHDVEHIKILLEKKADINIQNREYFSFKTPLFGAIEVSHEYVKYLLENNANPNQVNSKGQTPLMYAASLTKNENDASNKKYEKIIKSLIEAKADVKMKSNNNETVFTLAKGEAIKAYLRQFKPRGFLFIRKSTSSINHTPKSKLKQKFSKK